MRRLMSALSLLLICLVVQGCSTPARIIGYGVAYPYPDKFTLKGKLSGTQLLLDTEKVYIRTVRYIPQESLSYNILRIWPDGRCFWGTAAYSSIDRNSVEYLRIGNPGYYVLDGDIIVIETFSPEYSGSYAVSRGRLLRDDSNNIRIRIMETRYRGGFSLSMVRTYRYPYFGSQGRVEYGDFMPMDFGPLRSVPTWGGDL
jgi:hypothetical protein